MPAKSESLRAGLNLRVSNDANKVIEFLAYRDHKGNKRADVVRSWVDAKMSQEDPGIDDWLPAAEDLLGNKEIFVRLSPEARGFLADIALAADTLEDLSATDAMRAIVAEGIAQAVPDIRQNFEEAAAGPAITGPGSERLELAESLRPAIDRLCPVEA